MSATVTLGINKTYEVAMLMAYEVTRDLPLKEIEIETPIGKANARL